jgi:hypothetical protein
MALAAGPCRSVIGDDPKRLANLAREPRLAMLSSMREVTRCG